MTPRPRTAFSQKYQCWTRSWTVCRNWAIILRSHWGAAMELGGWLRGLGLEQYEANFRDNKLDAELLPRLTGDDLKEIGVSALGDRLRLLDALATLAGAKPSADAAVSSSMPVPAKTLQVSAERRPITVMFCDLVGSTSLAAKLDAEDWRNLVNAYLDEASAAVTGLGGHVLKRLGDGLMALFGYPQAQENDAERAVRAALTIQRALGEMNARNAAKGAPELSARIGLESGPVVVEAAGEVFGDAPNVAARVQSLAGPGSVLITMSVQRQVAGLFVVEEQGAREIKGVSEPVHLFRIVRASGGRRFGARALTPLVGREEELDLLRRRWDRAAKGEGQFVQIVGEPGIGKSRLVEEFRLKLVETPHTWVEFSSSQLFQNTPLHPIAEWGRQRFGDADTAAGQRLADLENTLELIGLDPGHAPLIAPLVDIPLPPSGAANLPPEQLRRRQLAALIAWFLAGARSQPAALAFEDLHWLDPTSLDLMQALIERGRTVPLFIIATARPEFRSPWSLRSHHSIISLSPLNRADVAQMVGEVAARHALSKDILEGVSERTGGVPLYVEEVARLLLERGEAGGLQAIPPTLQQSLAARLDRLGEAREVAQIGAVIGREFSHELLAAVADRRSEQLENELDQLAASELVFRRGGLPDAAYSFKHALVRDAAYQSLLKSKRQQLHARVAQVFEERFPTVVETQPELLAYHLTEAGLDERAAGAWARAGRAALGRSAMREAANSLSRAVGLLRGLPSSPDRQRQELELLGGLGVALTNTLGPASSEAQAAHERAAQLSQELGDREGRFRARWNLWRVYNVRAEFASAVAMGDALLAEAQAEGDVDHEVQARHSLWSSAIFRGDLEAVCSHVDCGLALYDIERHGTQALAFGGHDAKECGLTNSGGALFLLGYPERALARNAEGMAHALALGQPQVVAHALNWGSMLPQLAGELEELDRRAGQAARLAEEHGLAIYYSEARILAAWRAVCEERDHRAVEVMRNFLDRRAAMGTVSIHTYFLMLLADAWLRLGRPDESAATIKEGLARAEALGENFCTAELHRLRARACLDLDARAGQVAEAALDAALAAARRQSSRIFELRAACDLVRLWADRGERRKARDMLAPIYGWFTEGFNTADLKAAKALLGELA
jgi:class 3 adenylate cyclase/predicted ATPase